MSTEYTIQPKTLPALVKVLSGLFNLTKKEAQVLSALIHVMKELNVTKVDKDVKKQICNISNFSYQVTTNYTNILKQKKALNPDGSLHPSLTANKITINYAKNTV